MKSIVKLLLYFIGFIFHRSKKSKIIYYHDVGCTYTDMGSDMILMKRHFDIVRKSGFTFVDDITDKNRQVMVCFDDGWAGLYDNRSFFIEQKVYPTVFIAVDLIGQEGYLSIDQIKELMSLGFHFDCHTWTHTGLPDHHGDDLMHELKDSKEWLENTFQKPFESMCFPQGRFSDEVLVACRNCDYKKLYSSIAGGYYDLQNDGLICRNLVQYTSPLQFYFMLNSNSKYFQNRTKKLHYEK